MLCYRSWYLGGVDQVSMPVAGEGKSKFRKVGTCRKTPRFVHACSSSARTAGMTPAVKWMCCQAVLTMRVEQAGSIAKATARMRSNALMDRAHYSQTGNATHPQ